MGETMVATLGGKTLTLRPARLEDAHRTLHRIIEQMKPDDDPAGYLYKRMLYTVQECARDEAGNLLPLSWYEALPHAEYPAFQEAFRRITEGATYPEKGNGVKPGEASGPTKNSENSAASSG